MLLKIVYLLTCRVLGLAVLVFRGDRAKDAELLVLRHENAVLRRRAGRVRDEPAGRVWFAALARLLPRRRWTGIFSVTPATILAWHRKRAGNEYDTGKRRKPGRPPTVPGIARLVVRRAKENPLWGHRRIHGELRKLGVAVAPSAVWEIVRAAGIDPAPRRPGPTWRQFLHAQAAGILAAGFLHVDTLLLKRLYVLVFIEHGSRRMHPWRRHSEPRRRLHRAAGPQPRPHPRRADRGHQIPDPGPRIELHPLVRRRLPSRRHQDLAHRRPGSADERDLRAPAGTLRRELPDRLLILAEGHLRAVLAEYQAHYNTARLHQGIAQRVPDGEHEGSHITVTDLDREPIHRNPSWTA